MLLDAFQRLSEHGSPSSDSFSGSPISAEELGAARQQLLEQDEEPSLWQDAAQAGVSFSRVAKSLGLLVRDAEGAAAAAAFYTTLLRLKGAPVSGWSCPGPQHATMLCTPVCTLNHHAGLVPLRPLHVLGPDASP